MEDVLGAEILAPPQARGQRCHSSRGAAFAGRAVIASGRMPMVSGEPAGRRDRERQPAAEKLDRAARARPRRAGG